MSILPLIFSSFLLNDQQHSATRSCRDNELTTCAKIMIRYKLFACKSFWGTCHFSLTFFPAQRGVHKQNPWKWADNDWAGDSSSTIIIEVIAPPLSQLAFRLHPCAAMEEQDSRPVAGSRPIRPAHRELFRTGLNVGETTRALPYRERRGTILDA